MRAQIDGCQVVIKVSLVLAEPALPSYQDLERPIHAPILGLATAAPQASVCRVQVEKSGEQAYVCRARAAVVGHSFHALKLNALPFTRCLVAVHLKR
jgi:hypothetical protein